MADFRIKKPPYDLTSNAGLALVGRYTKRLGINALVDRKFPVAVGGIPNRDILKSYLGLLVQGKNDFDAIEKFRGDAFFAWVTMRWLSCPTSSVFWTKSTLGQQHNASTPSRRSSTSRPKWTHRRARRSSRTWPDPIGATP